MNVNKVFKIESISKDDLIVWFRKNISNKLHSIEELGNGGDFLVAMETLIPGTVTLQKVKFNKTSESDRLRNFRTLRKLFHKLGIDKDIEAEKMVRGLFKENYHFGLWFRAFFRANYRGGNRPPLDSVNALKQEQRIKTGLVNEESGESGVVRNGEDFPDINQNEKINDSTLEPRDLKESDKEYAPSQTTVILKRSPNFENKQARKDVNKYCSVKNTSKQDLVRWFRSTLSSNIHCVEELGTGVDFCLGLEVLFPGSIPMHLIRFSKTSESERVSNFRVLGRALDEFGVEKEMYPERLAKGIFKDNFQFGQWFKAFFLSNYQGQEYDVDEIRATRKKKSKLRLDSLNGQTNRISSKAMLTDNIGQGDAFSHDGFGQTARKEELGLPEVGNNISQESVVDTGSQTDQPLPCVNRLTVSSAENSSNQDLLLRIRFACEQLPDNQLSQVIIRLLDGDNVDGDDNDDDNDEKEEGEEENEEELSYEETDEYEESKEEIRSHGGQLLPAL